MKAQEILNFHGPERMADGRESANHYQHRHAQRRRYTTPHGRALRAMIEGWASYAEAHADAFEQPIGEDYYLGPAWADQARRILDLLNGELGGWDAGSLDHNIRTFAGEHGVDLMND